MRFLLRVLGFALLLTAFVVGVFDAARSLGNSALTLTPLGQSLYELLSERYLLLQPAIERHVSQALWDYVVLPVTLWPTALVALGLAVIFFLLGSIPRRPRPLDES